MSAFNKVILSAGADGVGVLVAATSTAGTTIHTAITGTTHIDEVWLWAVNTDTSAILLTIEFGGAAAVNQIPYTVPAQDGLHLVVPGLPLQDGGSRTVAAFAGTTNKISLQGYVNRILNVEGL